MPDSYTHDGISDTLAGWARRAGIGYGTLRARIKRGWTIGEALRVPIQIQAAASVGTGLKRCARCGEEKPVSEFTRLKRRSGREFCPRCRECEKIRCREGREKVRRDVIAHYSWGSMKCEQCGESRIAVLDIDHIDGGGIAERKRFATPQAYYIYLRRNKPGGLRVLCRNCNWIAWIERKNRIIGGSAAGKGGW